MSPFASKARLFAFYLPQFHPIPENNAWWGEGFTEWTNVARARPLFPGHYQPRLPADLGFYDLRVPETRLAQANLARQYGLEGFCYWHYWFGGKRLLERPFNEVVETGQPDFPFCLAWANQSWTGIWHGAPERILIEQTYPGSQDYVAHFNALLKAFADHRYLTIDGKPVFLVFRPHELPAPRQFTDCWRELALRAGFKGMYLIGIAHKEWEPIENGFDACMLSEPGSMIRYLPKIVQPLTWGQRLAPRLFPKPQRLPDMYDYNDINRCPVLKETPDNIPCVVPNWDNTPRSGRRGFLFANATPQAFRIHLHSAIQQVAGRPADHRLVFLKSWNEWAEGNYLEPDEQFGHAYLQACQEELR